MKRIARAAAAALLSLGLLAQPALAAESKIQIVLQGAPVQFEEGADPFVENSRTLVPLRTLSEKLGFMVEWEPVSQQITLTKFPNKIVLWVGKLEAEVNGQPFTLEVAPKIVGSRTFVPVRFISEQLGANVYWDGAKSTVRVTPQGQSDPGALALLQAQQSTQNAPAAANQVAHADLWLKVTQPGQETMELNGSIDLQVQGKEFYGDLALTMPMLGVNLPMVDAEFAVRNNFLWAKLNGGMILQQMGTELPEGWIPVGSMADFAPTFDPNASVSDLPAGFDPAEMQKLVEEIMGQLVVTFGPGEVRNGKQLARIDVDASKIDFLAIGAKVMGEEIPPMTEEMPEIDATLSFLVEEETGALRVMQMNLLIGDAEMQMEMKIELTLDPATAPITWPADLPAEAPAVPSGLEETLFPPILPTLPGGNA